MAQTYDTNGGRVEKMRPLFGTAGSAAASPGATAAAAASAPSASAPDQAGAAANGSNVALPNEGIYQEQQNLANKAYQDAMTGIQASRSGIQRQYGFMDDGSVDPNNTLGLYQQNRRNSAIELGNAEESALHRGLGHSGLGAQVAEAPRYSEEVSAGNLIQQYLQGLAGNSMDSRNATSTRTQALLTARAQQLRGAAAAGNFTPAGTDGPGMTTTDDGTTPPVTPPATPPGKTSGKGLDVQRALLARSLALNAKYGLGKKAKASTYGGRH